MSRAWPWIAITLLGAYHGLDPSMGWLFAVALGLQENRRSKVISALFPIAIGHFISIALVVTLVAGAAMSRAWWLLRPGGAVVLILFGLFRLMRPRAHPRWVAMKVSAIDLVVWSFLMATAHGAGLMLFPILLRIPSSSSAMPMMPHHHAMPAIGAGALGLAASAAVVVLHTGAMFLTMGTIAIVVYEWVGLRILRSAWINLDAIWAGALIAAGALSIVI
ncbi:MAG: hypothetical protein ACREQD_00510 [Candidatus Binataceae bacterium]